MDTKYIYIKDKKEQLDKETELLHHLMESDFISSYLKDSLNALFLEKMDHYRTLVVFKRMIENTSELRAYYCLDS